jgi:hypothetical protein
MSVHQLAKQEISVAANDVTGVVLTISTPLALNGHVVFAGSGTQNLSQTNISLRSVESASGGYQVVKAQPDGSFKFAGCDPAQYAVRVVPPSSKYVASIEFNRQDVMNHPLDLSSGASGDLTVTLAEGVAEVSGTVQLSSNAGQPGRRYVVLIPANWHPDLQNDWQRREIRDGKFLFNGLAPGEYVVAAMDWGDNSGTLWDEPDFIRDLQSKGQALNLRPGDHPQISIPMLTDGDIAQAASHLGL